MPESEAPRLTLDVTHWSFWDDPDRALCGVWIDAREFSPAPTCPHCRRLLIELEQQGSFDVRPH